MKEHEKCRKRAITDLNAPNGSRDISFQSQKFGQDGHRHFVGFQPHFHLNMTSQTQYFKTMKKWKWNISGVFCLICLQAVRTWQKIFASFQILLLWQPESKLLSAVKKQKVYCLSKSNVRNVIWNNTVWLLLQVGSSFEENWVIHFSYC